MSHKDYDPNGPLCGAQRKTRRLPCRQPAGHKTTHQGEGPCILHGGEAPLTRWVYGAKENRPRFHAALDELRKDPRHDDLTEELCLLRGLLSSYLAEITESSGENRRYEIDTVTKCVEAIAKVLDQMERLRRGYNISIETLDAVTHHMAMALSRVLQRHVPDEDKRAAILRAIDKAWDAIELDAGSPTARHRTGMH